MPRPKKDYMPLNMKVESGVMKRFIEYCEEVGQTKTLAFERIVKDYLNQYDKNKKSMTKQQDNSDGYNATSD